MYLNALWLVSVSEYLRICVVSRSICVSERCSNGTKWHSGHLLRVSSCANRPPGRDELTVLLGAFHPLSSLSLSLHLLFDQLLAKYFFFFFINNMKNILKHLYAKFWPLSLDPWPEIKSIIITLLSFTQITWPENRIQSQSLHLLHFECYLFPYSISISKAKHFVAFRGRILVDNLFAAIVQCWTRSTAPNV